MNPTERGELLDRERRWMRPAGVAAILGVLALAIGGAVSGSALDGDSVSERLLEAADGNADGQLLLGASISAAAFLAFAAALTFLFFAAAGRSDRVMRPLAGLALAGAVLIAGSQIADHSAYLSAADDFAASEAQREAQPAEDAAPESSDDAEDEADDRAEEALDDADGAALAGILGAGGTVGFTIGFFYTALWGMRTGLLTRFWGSFGMASAVVLVLLPPFAILMLVWFLALGLMLLGVWFGGRPPAWEAGTAIPWPKPGEEPADAAPDSVEGHGRELSERPLPEDSEGGLDAPSDTPAEPPQKRKRRR